MTIRTKKYPTFINSVKKPSSVQRHVSSGAHFQHSSERWHTIATARSSNSEIGKRLTNYRRMSGSRTEDGISLI